MNRSQLRAAVVGNIGRGGGSSVFDIAIAARIDLELNMGAKHISRLHPFIRNRPQLDVAFTSGAYRVQLDPGVRQLIELRLVIPPTAATAGSAIPLQLHNKSWHTERYPNVPQVVTSGRPKYVYFDYPWLYFDIVSNGNYVIRYTYYTNPEFTSDNSDNPVPDTDDALIAYVTAELYESTQQYEDSAFWMTKFESLIKAQITSEEREIGVSRAADPWTRFGQPQTPQPWLDPFNSGSGDVNNGT